MNEIPISKTDAAVIRFSRLLGHTRAGHVAVAVSMVAVSGVLGWFTWQNRDLAAVVLTFWLLAYGFEFAIKMVVSAQTRARWQSERELLKDHWSLSCRFFVFYPLVAIGVRYAQEEIQDFARPSLLWVTGSLMLFGVFAHVVSRRKLRQIRAAAATA